MTMRGDAEWACEFSSLSDTTVRMRWQQRGEAASVATVLAALRGDPDFRAAFNAELAGLPFEAFRWECPPQTVRTQGEPFECVVLDSPELRKAADPRAFAEHFGAATGGVATFANLRGDATLVVPAAADADYPHLAAFARRAPESLVDRLWSAVAAAAMDRLSDQPLWLSTAGAGVPWLHVRLDDRPKYYRHEPYRHPR